LRSLSAPPAEEEVDVCPVHHSHWCGCGKTAGVPAVAFAFAACFALGCASGTSGDLGGFDTDAACITEGCTAADSGPSFGDAPVYEATTSDPDTGHLDSGTTSPDVLEAFDHEVHIEAAVTCALRLSTPLAACNTCLSASCCSQDNACAGDPACLAFDDCEAKCEEPIDASVPEAGSEAGVDAGLDAGVAECMNECEVRYPVGSSLLSALDTCLETTCGSACDAL
jgi:hypothetical protein